MAQQLFVNLPVKDLQKTIAFFTNLGFKFNPKFTNEKSTCMVIGENIFAMLLVEETFKSFLRNKEIPNTHKQTEVLLALSCTNKAQVDEMMKKVLAGGGKEAREVQDMGWMYGRAFDDLDGHTWELFFMDEKAMPQG